MQYSDIRSDVYDLTNSTSASYLTATVLRNINQAYHEVTYQIWDSQDAWQFDDRTKSDLPYFRTTLVHDQQAYSIPDTIQKISRIEILDSASNWTKLTQMDNHDITVGLPEYMEIADIPLKYTLRGNFISLYPPPASGSVTTSSGMAFYGSRDVTEFDGNTATAVPGFAKQFHRILSYAAAIDFQEDPDRKQELVRRKDVLEKGLKRFYSKRMIERPNAIRPRSRKFQNQYK